MLCDSDMLTIISLPDTSLCWRIFGGEAGSVTANTLVESFTIVHWRVAQLAGTNDASGHL